MEAQNRGKRLVKYIPDYIVFDLETTGVNVRNDNIIEISAVKVREGTIADTFQTLVSPGRSIPYEATMIHGITDDMVADAPGLKTALSEFIAYIGKDVLVGHNIQSFDLNFINSAAEELFGTVIENDYIDTLYLSRSCLPGLSHYRLADIAQHFGISQEGAHRALNDCIMNQKCFEELGKLQAGLVLDLCPRCGGELIKRNGKFGEFFGCGNYPACRFTRNIAKQH